TPRAECTQNSHYDVLDLQTLPDDYLPRTNYIPACTPDEYRARTPKVSWVEPSLREPKRVTEYYRVISRTMLSQSGERTLISAVVPPGTGHLDLGFSVAFKDSSKLLDLCCMYLSIPADFFVKSTGKGHF